MINPDIQARLRVVNFFNDFRLDGVEEITLEDTSLLWYTFSSSDWKAFIKTNKGDEIYYEVAYNNAKKETYLDVYTKAYNFVISDVEKEDPNQLSFDVI